MANIVSNKAYLNDLEISDDAPITTDLLTKVGASINALLDESAAGVTDILASGSYTTPEGVTRLFIEGVGGGGGGSGGATSSTGGGAGGNAGRIFKGYITVVGNTLYSITIGGGGGGGPANSVGGTGADTTFGALLNISGGFRGNAPVGVTPGTTFTQGGYSGSRGGIASTVTAGTSDNTAQGSGEGASGVLNGGGGGGGYGGIVTGGGGAGGTGSGGGTGSAGAAGTANTGSGGGGGGASGGGVGASGGAGATGSMRIFLV